LLFYNCGCFFFFHRDSFGHLRLELQVVKQTHRGLLLMVCNLHESKSRHDWYLASLFGRGLGSLFHCYLANLFHWGLVHLLRLLYFF
jgi:hypothetical protein